MRRAVERYLEDPLRGIAPPLVKGRRSRRVIATDGKLSFHVTEPQNSAAVSAAS